MISSRKGLAAEAGDGPLRIPFRPSAATAHGHADHVGGTLLTFRTSWQPDL
jgi:hypothetical protein